MIRLWYCIVFSSWIIDDFFDKKKFNTQNVENRITDRLDFKIFWGHAPRPPCKKGSLYGSFDWHSRLI